MCEHCAEKYKGVLKDELSDEGIGACSVEGCSNVGADMDTESHYYVDFKPELVKFIPKLKEQAIDIHAGIGEKNCEASKEKATKGCIQEVAGC